MKNLNLSRVVAYLIDIIIVGAIASVFSYIPFLNPERIDYEKQYDALMEIYQSYRDGNMKEEEYMTQYTSFYYDLNRLNVNYTVINLVVLVAYFGVFQWQRNGKTIGKKLMKIKVVSHNEKPLGFVSYLIRSIILNNIIITILQLIVLFIFSKEQYYIIYSNINLVGYILLYINVFLVFIRQDKRGLHDLVAGTKVVSIFESETVPEAQYTEVKETKKVRNSKK